MPGTYKGHGMDDERKTTLVSIFPALAGRTAGYINLNDHAVQVPPVNGRSVFLDATLTDKFLAAAHARMNVDYSLGGYLEDRRDLWRGSYLDEQSAVHLGIDVNVPAGTGVSVAHASRVEKIVHDPDQNGGWGTAVIFKLEEPRGQAAYFVYGHLSSELAVKEGDLVRPGDVVGKIGQHHENGGWYEHLHVQAITADAWEKFGGDLRNFDGYAADPHAAEHPYFPDPMPLLVP